MEVVLIFLQQDETLLDGRIVVNFSQNGVADGIPQPDGDNVTTTRLKKDHKHRYPHLIRACTLLIF
jgi:hypothetical protein